MLVGTLQVYAVILSPNSIVFTGYSVVPINDAMVEAPVEKVDTGDREDYDYDSTYRYYVEDLAQRADD